MLAKRWAGFTLMASAADDSAVQCVLPQIILANRNTLRRADWEALGEGICAPTTSSCCGAKAAWPPRAPLWNLSGCSQRCWSPSPSSGM